MVSNDKKDQSFKRLKDKLAELFQLDQADLDFGIYRIMNAKRDEINQFLDKDLLPQVKEAFAEYSSKDKLQLQKELNQKIINIKELGMDPESSPVVKELRSRINEMPDISAMENEVYSHLYSFFNRYYDNGDFISLRRYKEGVYAIPYEGEEVKLHWANHDQYYIKTTEYFHDYTFKILDGRRVHFKIIEADTEKDNVKAEKGKERRFMLHKNNSIIEDNDELIIRFEYTAPAESKKQEEINQAIISEILNNDNLNIYWKEALGKIDYTSKNKSVIEKHLECYTKRNTFDYFIHKDLGKFLMRELDFYIKNEIMHLDDIDKEESIPRVEQYLAKIKVVKKIAHKIIYFLSQIEDFQKKLWLKKKFVIETNYCVTLDRVPEELYHEIAANDAQREEWVRLFAIDEIKPDLVNFGYSERLTVEFIRSNPFLLIDTKFYNSKFVQKLISSFSNIEENTNGLLIRSENFQALNMLQSNYKDNVGCIYIDPPYNTGTDGFIYKDTYQDSTWLQMIKERIMSSVNLLSSDGAFFMSIDDNESSKVQLLLSDIFGIDNFIAQLVWKKKYTGGKHAKYYAYMHEYILCFSKKMQDLIGFKIARPEKEKQKFIYEDKYIKERGKYYIRPLKSNLEERLTLVYPIKLPDGKEIKTQWIVSQDTYNNLLNEERIEHRKKKNGEYQVYKKYYENDDEGKIKIPSIIDHTNNNEAKLELKQLFNVKEGRDNVFYTVKPVALISHLIKPLMSRKKCVLDYFAGSGTTAHSVIKLNREEGDKRKYILIEMGEYFDTVLVPRIKKVIYSKDWKDGKPVSREGISHMFKYIKLESYEDTLMNLLLKRTGTQQKMLDLESAKDLRESYMLKYMLDTETKGSPSLLDIDQFDDPFNYKLLVGSASVGETKAVNVDLVETFNWLLGLKVKHIDYIEGFCVVEGSNPKDEKVLIIWRKIRELSEHDQNKINAQRAEANIKLEEFFKKQHYNTLDMEFDIIYV
ncbi:MAG TPA: site-specific DNA-methyltransferase, partial [Candidatus Nanoarchaeia archaeon]|nr:site-specific DNA-methyltransferase [Candidatus Nanoarchaeia archaeon]